jgi:DNA-binding response OmpR family regulator
MEPSNLLRPGYLGTDLATKLLPEDPKYSHMQPSRTRIKRRGTMAEKILVVDDEKEIRDLLSIYLMEDGYEVIAASNGQEAISLAQAELPQVILMDVKMPGIDGVETCKRLKEEERTKSIPIIMVTAYQDRDVEAYLEGADDFVNKPFDKTEITFRVRSMMRIRHLNDELERAMAYIEELDKNLPKR